METNPCTVGEHLQMTLDCHKTTICRQTGLRQLSELGESDALLLQLRTGLMGLVEGDTVCLHHEKVFVERYEHTQRTCCDPFNNHKKAIRKGLRPIDLDEATFLTDRFALQFVPGWKLCARCAQLLNGYADVDVDLRQRRQRDREVCIFGRVGEWSVLLYLVTGHYRNSAFKNKKTFCVNWL